MEAMAFVKRACVELSCGSEGGAFAVGPQQNQQAEGHHYGEEDEGTLVLMGVVGDKTGDNGEDNAAEIIENLQPLEGFGVLLTGGQVLCPQGRANIEKRSAQTQHNGEGEAPEGVAAVHAKDEEAACNENEEQQDAALLRADAVGDAAGNELADNEHEAEEGDERGGQLRAVAAGAGEDAQMSREGQACAAV